MSKKVSFFVAPTTVKNAFKRSNSLLRSSFKSSEMPKKPEETVNKPDELPAEDQVMKPAKSSNKRKNRPQKRTINGYVGFANLPNQVHSKAVKRGFHFTVMVVGESGLGKSTLVNSMFLSDVYSSEYPGPSERIKKTVAVEATTVQLNENGVYLRLTVVDCPGFGDAVDNSNCWKPIIDYIETKYEDYLTEESKVNRMILRDERVHCCLYFIQPSGHGLKNLDIQSMKRLSSKVNLIPIIAKADTLTVDERVSFKKQILEEIAENNIKIYKFPEDEDDLDGSQNERFPFAVVGSNTIYEVDGKNVRGRQYPWGVINVEDSEHCDFTALRNTLICTHMQDLIDVTNEVHYENYRSKRLASLGITGKITQLSNKNPIALIAEEKRERVDKLKNIEEELQKSFDENVQQKMERLRILEEELQAEYVTNQWLLEAQKKDLVERKKKFEEERENNPVKTMSRSNESVDGKKSKLKNLFHKNA